MTQQKSEFAVAVQMGVDKSDMAITKAASAAARVSHRHSQKLEDNCGLFREIVDRRSFLRLALRGISVAPLSCGRRPLR